MRQEPCRFVVSSSSRQHGTFVVQEPQDDDNNDSQERTEKLLSYVYTLQRARKEQGSPLLASEDACKPAKSLVAYLTHNPLPLVMVHPVATTTTPTPTLDDNVEQEEIIPSSSSKQQEFQQTLARAIIQAIRAAGEAGDYKLVRSLVDASIVYANNHAILTPRIFGEAIDALSKTQSNASKLKYIWSLVDGTIIASDNNNTGEERRPAFLEYSLTAYELNVMLKALATRGKIRACLDLYRQHATTPATTDGNGNTGAAGIRIVPDAYTASTLFTILTDSIRPDQPLLSTPPAVRMKAARKNTNTNETASSPDNNYGSFLQHSLVQLSPHSPCWQWNEAMELLGTLEHISQWNNHVFASLLKLQDKTQELFGGRLYQNGPQLALRILESMMQQDILPDVVTCTLVIKATGGDGQSKDGQSWKLAVRLLEQMIHQTNLPNPNVYTYSAAIVACARCYEYPVALKLLQDMRGQDDDDGEDGHKPDTETALRFTPPRPNTWVYNAALLAIAASPEEKHRKQQVVTSGHKRIQERQGLALKLLKQMYRDRVERGMDTAPDTVTYNTVLAIVASSDATGNNINATTSVDNIVNGLLFQMKEKDILRDAITYRHAILASSDGNGVLRMVQAALDDAASIGGTTDSSHATKPLEGKAVNGLTFVFNSALSVLASRGDLATFKEAFSRMQKANISTNSEASTNLINAFCRGGQSSAIILVLKAIDGRVPSVLARKQLFQSYGVDISPTCLPPLEASHYSAAISGCLIANEIKHAHQVLSLMRENNLAPTVDCLQNFALAYARVATSSAAQESRRASQQGGSLQSTQPTSRGRAQSAYNITMALDDPPLHLLSAVAKACAATGMWGETHSTLRAAHKRFMDDHVDATSAARGEIAILQSLHRTLLRQCALKGNVTAALWFVDDIQLLSTKMRPSPNATRTISGDLKEGGGSFSFAAATNQQRVPVGMKAKDWTFLMTAASKSGHWRVCMSTLQFLRPFLEKTHPSLATAKNQERLQIRYDQLACALNSAVRCLGQRSQYGWALRVIEDWMEWSGRRPPVEAVLAAVRILSARSRGDQVNGLISRCVLQPPKTVATRKGVNYEELLYVGTITSLHNNGLYDDADEAFVSAISQGCLSIALEKQKDQVILDLHGLNVALAHCAVRIAMRRQVIDLEAGMAMTDMVIVTGRGRNSALNMRPVLRPEVQRMLLEEFYPPLNTMSVPGNMGALRVPAADISAWQAHQQEQKGVRMLLVADVLKNLSSGDRLRKIIALSLSNSGKSNEGNDSKV
jgi:pentatricopeptide repeat protein